MDTTPNDQAVICLKQLGFEMPSIRRALIKLLGTTEPELARSCNIARPTVAAHISGARSTLRTQALIAQRLGVRAEVLFDEWADFQAETGAVLRTVAEPSACEGEAA